MSEDFKDNLIIFLLEVVLVIVTCGGYILVKFHEWWCYYKEKKELRERWRHIREYDLHVERASLWQAVHEIEAERKSS